MGNRARDEGHQEIVLCITDTLVGRTKSKAAPRAAKKDQDEKPAKNIDDTGFVSESGGDDDASGDNESQSGKSSATEANHSQANQTPETPEAKRTPDQVITASEIYYNLSNSNQVLLKSSSTQKEVIRAIRARYPSTTM